MNVGGVRIKLIIKAIDTYLKYLDDTRALYQEDR